MVQEPDDPYLTKSDAFVSADGSICVDGNTLVLKFMDPTDVEVYDMLGRVVYTRSGLRQGSVDLNRGVYTVKYGDSVKKILISEER